MKAVTFTELRNHAREYFDAVEEGKEFEVYRRGKPVALLTPIHRPSSRWKEAHPRVLRSGASLSDAILAERDETPR